MRIEREASNSNTSKAQCLSQVTLLNVKRHKLMHHTGTHAKGTQKGKAPKDTHAKLERF